eukprot:jgi/Botrbrau1/10579/Bobra.0358s0002.1
MGREQRAHTGGRLFLGADGVPVTFQDMMQAVTSSAAFQGSVTFVGEKGASQGKRIDNRATQEALGWQPKYSSFRAFMEGGARDWYSEAGLQSPQGAPHKG